MSGRKPPQTPDVIRRERLAEALRANLRRRKAAAAGRPAEPPKGQETAANPPGEPPVSGTRKP